MQRDADRDERLLAHLGLYRVSTRPVLAMLFFGGRTPGNVLHRLIAEGRIVSRPGLPGRQRYYQLTHAEALRRGLPPDRGRPPGPQAMRAHLAILAHCCARPKGPSCRRLEDAELAALFGASAPRGTHVLEAGTSPRVLRVLVVGASVRVGRVHRVLRRHIQRVRTHPTLGAWVRNRQYGFLLLAESEAKAARLRAEVHRHDGTINIIATGTAPGLFRLGWRSQPGKGAPGAPST